MAAKKKKAKVTKKAKKKTAKKPAKKTSKRSPSARKKKTTKKAQARGKAKSKAKKPPPDKLEETGATDRDEAGRFLPGHKGLGGRPKGLDFKKIVNEHAEKNNIDMGDAIWQIAEMLKRRALKTFDVQAAKLYLDRCCGPLKHELDVQSSSTTVHVGAQAIDTLRAIIGNKKAQGAFLDELQDLTMGNDES